MMVKAEQLAGHIREAFARAGDPAELTVDNIVDYLRTVDPKAWRRWDKRRDRLAMAGRSLASTFRAADLVIRTVRLNSPGRPTAYQLEQILRIVN